MTINSKEFEFPYSLFCNLVTLDCRLFIGNELKYYIVQGPKISRCIVSSSELDSLLEHYGLEFRNKSQVPRYSCCVVDNVCKVNIPVPDTSKQSDIVKYWQIFGSNFNTLDVSARSLSFALSIVYSLLEDALKSLKSKRVVNTQDKLAGSEFRTGSTERLTNPMEFFRITDSVSGDVFYASIFSSVLVKGLKDGVKVNLNKSKLVFTQEDFDIFSSVVKTVVFTSVRSDFIVGYRKEQHKISSNVESSIDNTSNFYFVRETAPIELIWYNKPFVASLYVDDKGIYSYFTLDTLRKFYLPNNIFRKLSESSLPSYFEGSLQRKVPGDNLSFKLNRLVLEYCELASKGNKFLGNCAYPLSETRKGYDYSKHAGGYPSQREVISYEYSSIAKPEVREVEAKTETVNKKSAGFFRALFKGGK